MSKNMQQWELKQKQKIHKQKIKNAKSTIKNPKSMIIEVDEGDPLDDTQEIYLYNSLKKHSLQQYYKKLTEMKETTFSLMDKTTTELDELCEVLKILPGHRAKFNKLIQYLRCPQIEYTRNSSICKDKPQTNSTKATKERYSEPDDALMLCSEKSMELDHENQKLKDELEMAMKKIQELEEQLHDEPDSPKVPVQKLDPFEPLPEIEKKINEVGVSYDSSKLRSTLHHIDLEEMCRSLSRIVLKVVVHGMEVEKNRALIPDLRESLASLPDLYEDFKKDTAKSKSSLMSSIGTYSMDYSMDSAHPIMELTQITEKSYEEGSPQKNFTEAGEVKVPSNIQEIFNTEFDDYNCFPGVPPTEEEIYNFCKNVIARSRMEKEVSILCLIYMERFIEKTGIYVSEKNWKKLLFMCLILASKIWDDESYENVHFAQVFSIITLREINSMELIYLSMIDYEVNIKNSDYAKYYFALRTNAQKNNKSFPLKPLDVDVVLKLQKNSNSAEAALKEKMTESLMKTM